MVHPDKCPSVAATAATKLSEWSMGHPLWSSQKMLPRSPPYVYRKLSSSLNLYIGTTQKDEQHLLMFPIFLFSLSLFIYFWLQLWHIIK